MSLFDELPGQWGTELAFLKENFLRIEKHLIDQANSGARIAPERKNVFKALSISPRQAKVLIVGQDPYPNPLHAMGLSFSVPKGTRPLPGSLLNILKEIESDTGKPSQVIDGDLTPWVEQGVVLLNRTLTVRSGDSGSHQSLGWQTITDEIARRYAQHGAIAVLWGNAAQELKGFFPTERTIVGVHPSPLSAHRGFLGSRPFTSINRKLNALGKEEIIW